MHEFLAVVLKLTIIFFWVTAMLNVGMNLTVRQLIEPLRNATPVIKSLGVSFILIPLTAIVITTIDAGYSLAHCLLVQASGRVGNRSNCDADPSCTLCIKKWSTILEDLVLLNP